MAYMVTKQLIHRFGISRTTLWNWLKRNNNDFPKPIIINGKKYFDENDIEEYEQRLKDNYEKNLEEGRKKYERMVRGKNAKNSGNKNNMLTQQTSVE